MAAVSTNIKMDPEVKEQAQILFNQLGMSLSTAVNIFLKQAIREQSIPFRVGDPFYNRANQKHLQAVIHDIETGKSNLEEHALLED